MKILVTGAAGLIGGEVCARLARRGHLVTAMVRRNRQVRGNDGSLVPVARIVTGDVEHALIGLDPSDHKLDLVIHCAASLEFDAPGEVLQRANVAGTHNAVEFARACGARFLHVSTAYVCGLTRGPVAEAPVAPGTRFANGYEASKEMAERVVAGSGVSFAILRPSITLGDSQSGAIRDFPALCNVFRLMARGKVPVLPAAPDATLDLVPIDHVALGIVRTAEEMDRAAGRYLHLVGSAPLPAAELTRALARVPHFSHPRTILPEEYDPAMLSSAQRRLTTRMLDTFGSYFRRDPQFESTAAQEITHLSCPPTDRAWLDRLIGYGIARFYLPQPPSARAGNAARAAFASPAPTARLS